MDKTVRLWHISRDECLCAFQHLDFVTSIAFHPRDDRFFLSDSLDCKLRLWNVRQSSRCGPSIADTRAHRRFPRSAFMCGFPLTFSFEPSSLLS
jgi:WD40 repeat protein